MSSNPARSELKSRAELDDALCLWPLSVGCHTGPGIAFMAEDSGDHQRGGVVELRKPQAKGQQQQADDDQPPACILSGRAPLGCALPS